jgi:hypothetical protein
VLLLEVRAELLFESSAGVREAAGGAERTDRKVDVRSRDADRQARSR